MIIVQNLNTRQIEAFKDGIDLKPGERYSVLYAQGTMYDALASANNLISNLQEEIRLLQSKVDAYDQR